MLERLSVKIAIGLTVAVAILVWGLTGYHQRNALRTWIDLRCAEIGAAYQTAPPGPPGTACAARIDKLAAFERDALAESNAILGQAQQARQAKQADDTTRARADAQAAELARQKMEAANAAVQGDHVGPDWFDALNRTAGLRPPA